MNSILNDVKNALGISKNDHSFDNDIIMHINSVIMILGQIGDGINRDLVINGENETWDDIFITKNIQSVKTYIFLKVRLIFDPPQSSSVLESIKQVISELEWRLNIECDGKESEI